MKIMKRYIQVIFICWLSINSITEVYGKDPIGISLVKWSFRTQTAILCDMAKENGAVAIDMVDPEKWDIVKEKGLTVAMADGIDMGIERGFCAREEWGWKPEYNLQNMTVDMLVKVKEKFDKGLIK